MHSINFDFQSRTKVIQGPGSAHRVGELAGALAAKRALLVTDAGLVAAGHATLVQDSLQKSGLHVTVFDQARENPTTKCVDECVVVARSAGVDVIIGLGGGSSMDTAKGCNFLLTNGGRMQDYWGVGKATKAMLPFVAIPTTAGTGSEMQCAALIADEATHQKMACLDPKCAAAVAILDPCLTLSQPPRVTACTGIDAIAHAVETAVTTKRTPLSQRLSIEAFRLCIKALPQVLSKPADIEARTQMQLGAALAGAAIEHSMLGAAHAAANPLTAECGIIHGHAVGLMLPVVVEFNSGSESAKSIYEALAGNDGSNTLASQLREVLRFSGLPTTLAEAGVDQALIPKLAAGAERQWTAGFNPRKVTSAEFTALYEAAWRG